MTETKPHSSNWPNMSSDIPAINIGAAIINTLPAAQHQALIDYLDNNESHA